MPSRIILGIGIGTLAGHKEMFCVLHLSYIEEPL